MAMRATIFCFFAVVAAQCTGSHIVEYQGSTDHPIDPTYNDVVDRQGRTEHPIDPTYNDDPDKKLFFVENFEETNPDKVGDRELFQADMLLDDDQWEAILTRKALADERYRWSEGSDGFPYVPYVFQDSVDQNDVKAGIDHWEEHTCIKFEETTNTSQSHIQFHIGSGCWSWVGMLYYKNGQQISIGSGCNSLGTVVHEIGHAMGFHHEQSRSDRNDHVVIGWDYIRPGRAGNFYQTVDNNHSVTYDYSSDMHYSGRGFTTTGQLTITTKDPLAQELIGSRNGLSHRDKLLVNIIYGCLDKWLASCSLSSNPCQNEGYIGAKCSCVCPVSTSGTNCEKVNEEYYASLRNKKTEVISTEGTISEDIKGGDKFTKYIKAPECKTPKLTFQSFDFYRQSSFSSGYTYCYWEYLIIRTGQNFYSGDVYCDTEISNGQVFTSNTTEMILFVESKYYVGSTFSAQLTFEDVSGCTPTGTTTPAATTTPAPMILQCKKSKKPIAVSKGETVVFTSPKYPEKYPKKASCKWILKKPRAGTFVINCSKMELEPKRKRGGCKADVLKVGKKKYCGKTGPSNVYIKSEKVNISFKSNKKKEFKGFSCTATVV